MSKIFVPTEFGAIEVTFTEPKIEIDVNVALNMHNAKKGEDDGLSALGQQAAKPRVKEIVPLFKGTDVSTIKISGLEYRRMEEAINDYIYNHTTVFDNDRVKMEYASYLYG